jgi:hypothetical protein
MTTMALGGGRFAEAEELRERAEQLPTDPYDTEYAERDEYAQLSLGVAGEQRTIPGLANPCGEV